MPASATVGVILLMVTSSVEEVHGALAMVHLNTELVPVMPLTVALGLLIPVIIPVPLTRLHVPVPTIAVFPDKVAVLPQIF